MSAGISISGPTTLTNASPQFKPNTATATAIASSKLFPAAVKVIVADCGQAAAADLLDSARASGHDFDIISKPVHPANLLERIRNVIPVEQDPGLISEPVTFARWL
jgi:hypothetical protein